METNNFTKTPVQILVICALTVVGFTVLGLGIGFMIHKISAFTLIGVGLGFLFSAGLILRIYYQRKREDQ